jgi:hypothetical protein
MMALGTFVLSVLFVVLAAAFVPPEVRKESEQRREALRAEAEAERRAKEARRAQGRIDVEQVAERKWASATITAVNLLAEYEANEARANGRWKGKPAQVTGTVANVHQTLGTTVVQIGSGDRFELMTVSCRLQKSEIAKAEALNKGNAIVVRGVVSEAAGFVFLEDCVIHP